MASTRELKGRINSVHSSQKITGAMKMISSARLRKSENALNHARPYIEQLQNILDHIASEINDYQSPLSQDRPVQRVAIVILLPMKVYVALLTCYYTRNYWRHYKEYDGKVKSPVFVYPVGGESRERYKTDEGGGGYADPRSFRKNNMQKEQRHWQMN